VINVRDMFRSGSVCSVKRDNEAVSKGNKFKEHNEHYETRRAQRGYLYRKSVVFFMFRNVRCAPSCLLRQPHYICLISYIVLGRDTSL
jgi:hypothetical protein